jgi:hypothetical protein
MRTAKMAKHFLLREKLYLLYAFMILSGIQSTAKIAFNFPLLCAN